MQATISLPSDGAGVIVDYGSVWVTSPGKSELYRIDPGSNAVVAVTQLHPQPRFMTSADGSIWVLNQGDGTALTEREYTSEHANQRNSGAQPQCRNGKGLQPNGRVFAGN